MVDAVDPDLLKWIKVQLSSGASYRKIKSDLSSKGWEQKDIDEAYNLASGKNPSPPKKNKSSLALVLVLIFIILIGGSATYFLLAPNNNPFSIVNNNAPVKENVSSSTSSSINHNTLTCRDIDCFISASTNCSEADFTSTDSISLLGINSTTTSYLELDHSDNSCLLFQRIVNESLSYTPGAIQQFQSAGMTQNQISQQEIGINVAASVVIGKNGTCIFNSFTNLTEYLTKIKDGNFSGQYSCTFTPSGNNCNSTGDWNLASSCSGELFNDIGIGYQYAP